MYGILQKAFHGRKEGQAQSDGGGRVVLQDIWKPSWLQEGCLKKADMLDIVEIRT